MTISSRYPVQFEVFRLEPIGDPAYHDLDDAHLRYLYERGIHVVPAELSALGKPAWWLKISPKKARFGLRFYSDTGTPLREVTWGRDGEELVLQRTVDLFYPDGDPGGFVPSIRIPYVDRVYTTRGVVTVTFAPPGRASGVSRVRNNRRRPEPAPALHEPEAARNGPTHTVRDVLPSRLAIPEFGAWDELLDMSAPESLCRFGDGSAEAAAAYAAERPHPWAD